jgi:hypothetical protein
VQSQRAPVNSNAVGHWADSAHIWRQEMLRIIKLCLAVTTLLVMGVATAEEMAKSSFKYPPSYFPNTEELRADEMRIPKK